jgi:hypothetical protein
MGYGVDTSVLVWIKFETPKAVGGWEGPCVTASQPVRHLGYHGHGYEDNIQHYFWVGRRPSRPIGRSLQDRDTGTEPLRNDLPSEYRPKTAGTIPGPGSCVHAFTATA